MFFSKRALSLYSTKIATRRSVNGGLVDQRSNWLTPILRYEYAVTVLNIHETSQGGNTHYLAPIRFNSDPGDLRVYASSNSSYCFVFKNKLSFYSLSLFEREPANGVITIGVLQGVNLIFPCSIYSSSTQEMT